MTSYKNFSLSPAGTDLGLGDQLKNQLDAQEEERKKKALALQQAQRGQALGPATQELFGLGA